MIFASVLLLTILSGGFEASSSTQFKILRGHCNNFTVQNVKREKDLEYPGKNKEILKILKRKWENYYLCLLQKEKEEKKPEIRRLLEGQYTALHCDICPRPFQDYEELEWKYKPLSPDAGINELECLDLTPEMIYTANKTLQIFNAVQSVSGLYVCFHKTNVVSVYILEVSKNDTTEKVQTSTIKGDFSIKTKENDFEINYQWSDWSECNACGRVGRKFKYATCHVLLKGANDVKKTVSTQRSRCNASSEEKWHSSKSFDSLIISIEKVEEDISRMPITKTQSLNTTSEDDVNQFWTPELIKKFSTGIPCASEYLPKSGLEKIQKFKAIKVLVKYCWEPCKGTEIFEVFDNAGKLIEWANNTAGIYSVFQKIPQLPHDIGRRTVEADFGSEITIQCPGTSFTNTPVVWKVNKKIIFPDIIANESNGRFSIDLVNRINIKKLRVKDSNTYSCWERDKLVGTVHLIVEKKFKIGFDHHVTLIGLAAIIGVLLFVGSKILTRELKMRKK